MFGLLFSVIMNGLAVIDKYRKDRYYMSSPVYYQDGIPVYMDSSCNKYINGEKVINKYDYQNNKLIEVGTRSGKVYFDPELETKKRMDARSEKYKQEAIEKGMMAYMRYDHNRKKSLTCEISTDKFIAQLKGKEDGTYWKYYLPDSETIIFTRPAEGDKGVQITQEEYDKLNILVGGTHYASDLWRYDIRYGKNGIEYKRIPGR